MNKRFFVCIVIGLIPAIFSPALDFDDGAVRLSLNEKAGKFSLYHTSESTRSGYVPFFSDRDVKTSFLQVIYDNRIFKLGETSNFATWIKDDENNPGFIFGSNFLRVTQDFTFIKTAGSQSSNGVAMRVTIENLSPREAEVGLRFLLDTNLGERTASHFYASSRPVVSETMIERGSSERWWVSRGDALSLMGSISLPGEEWPGSVIFASWKRLSEAPWRFSFANGRSFNVFPFYMRDSAVCYYYEPRTLQGFESVSYVIVLAAEDSAGYVHTVSQAPQRAGTAAPTEAEIRRNDMELIQRLIYQIDALSSMNNASEDEITALEDALNELLQKYGINP